jgi:hypothetical protein
MMISQIIKISYPIDRMVCQTKATGVWVGKAMTD